jgi:hypothetical protein
MSNKLKITVSIEDEAGDTILTSQSERAVPYIEDIDKKGFRAAFHDLETAVLESRKEAGFGCAFFMALNSYVFFIFRA